MKKTLLLIVAALTATAAMAQERRLEATMFKEFKPAVITFSDGRKINQPLANVFLKNGALLFPKGDYTMEANMGNISAVDFADRHFVTIDQQLAYRVDSVEGGNALYCIELFDQETYNRNLRNNINISNLDLGDQISTTTIDINTEEDYKLPVFRHFYMQLDGQMVKVHERELNRKLNKEQRAMMKRIMALPDFSWQREETLMQLLKAISKSAE